MWLEISGSLPGVARFPRNYVTGKLPVLIPKPDNPSDILKSEVKGQNQGLGKAETILIEVVALLG